MDKPGLREEVERMRPRIILGRHARTFVPARVLEFGQVFIQTEASSGIVLLAAALAALVWANSPWNDSYEDLWHTSLTADLGLVSIAEDLRHAVNDGLMTIFFFTVGLEIKRELVHGELSDRRRALLPAAAALGGMVVPALIFLAFNAGGPGERGWGIPMATDIAFAVGVMALAGRSAPFGLKVFVLGLAIVDDIGAILVIALFYTSGLDLEALAIAGLIFVAIVAMNSRGVRNINVYVAAGAMMWLAVFESGVHPTLVGVVLGLLTPAQPFFDPKTFPGVASSLIERLEAARETDSTDDQESLLAQLEDATAGTQAPLERLEHSLHPWVSYGILPLFALANAGVEISPDTLQSAASSAVGQGVFLGLLAGKLAGIFLFTWAAVRLGVASLPTGTGWKHLAGAGLVCGIGFTVSLFIAGLAFETPELVEHTKVSILFASLSAGLLGFLSLRFLAGDRPEARQAAVQAA